MSTHYITTSDDLITFCERLQNAPWIALDTEFMRERTYYAKLCLVQIATPDVMACIDPLALDDLKPLLELVYNPQILKVLHSARQDLEVFFDLRGQPPSPVFDTQIAATFLGFDEQIGYAPLVEATTGVKLDKAHTRANWAARPLSAEQIVYAEDDVRYLRDVYRHLQQRLEETGRQAWLAEEFSQLVDPALYQNDPALAWRRLKHGYQLNPPAQRVLQALSRWRERMAQSYNLPRSWILRDPVMFDIARRTPQTPEQLCAIRDMEEKTARKWSAEILEIVSHYDPTDTQALWLPPVPMTAEQNQLCRAMARLLDHTALQHQLSPIALGTRRDLQHLVLGQTDLPMLRGWRYEIIGRQLLDLLEGRTAPMAET